MRRTSFRFLTVAAMAAVMGLSACSKDQVGKDDAFGYVQLQLNEPEVSIVTKAVNVISGDYTVVIKDSEPKEVKRDTYANLKAPFALVPGNYTIFAENMTADAALVDRGAQRFYGESSFAIQAGRITPVAFTCKMVNARVSVAYAASFNAVFRDVTVTIYESSSESRSLTFTKEATHELQHAYFNIDADPEITINIAVTRNDGVVDNYQKTLPIQAQHWHKITLSSNNTDGQAGLNVTVDDSLTESPDAWEVDPYAPQN